MAPNQGTIGDILNLNTVPENQSLEIFTHESWSRRHQSDFYGWALVLISANAGQT